MEPKESITRLDWVENLGTWEGKKDIFLCRVVKTNEFKYGSNFTWRVLVDGNAVAMGMTQTLGFAQAECEKVLHDITCALLRE